MATGIQMSRSTKTAAGTKDRVTIGGDLCPINANGSPCARGDAEAVFDGWLGAFGNAGLFVVNLETPLIERPIPINKSGPVIGAGRETAKMLLEVGIQAVSLANNHIMDHGTAGLASTMATIDELGVAFFGAGPDLGCAQKILVREVSGLRIGLLGVTHHEFSIAGPTTPGAAPLDPIEVYGQVAEQKRQLGRASRPGPCWYGALPVSFPLGSGSTAAPLWTSARLWSFTSTRNVPGLWKGTRAHSSSTGRGTCCSIGRTRRASGSKVFCWTSS
jgi:hypothetical protein